jgi:hypothetical protein
MPVDVGGAAPASARAWRLLVRFMLRQSLGYSAGPTAVFAGAAINLPAAEA